MYYLMVWDKELASIGQDGCLGKVEIPVDAANLLFHLDAEEFPMLTSLSFDDYDMFSGSQLDSLIAELLAAASLNSLVSILVKSMVELIFEARLLGKNVLFDPFRPC